MSRIATRYEVGNPTKGTLEFYQHISDAEECCRRNGKGSTLFDCMARVNTPDTWTFDGGILYRVTHVKGKQP